MSHVRHKSIDARTQPSLCCEPGNRCPTFVVAAEISAGTVANALLQYRCLSWEGYVVLHAQTFGFSGWHGTYCTSVLFCTMTFIHCVLKSARGGSSAHVQFLKCAPSPWGWKRKRGPRNRKWKEQKNDNQKLGVAIVATGPRADGVPDSTAEKKERKKPGKRKGRIRILLTVKIWPCHHPVHYCRHASMMSMSPFLSTFLWPPPPEFTQVPQGRPLSS